MWCWCVVSCAPLVVSFIVSTGVGEPALVACPLLSCRVPCLLSALLLCACRIACKYGSISHFKGVFSAFWGADVCLYGFGVLRGLCGFCARVELGGYMTCGVFASLLSSFVLFLVLYFVLYLVLLLLCSPFFLPSLLLLLSLFLLSSACPLGCLASALGLVLSLCGLLFLFPLRYVRKKKGRNSLRPLLSCCRLLFPLLLFGFNSQPFLYLVKVEAKYVI